MKKSKSRQLPLTVKLGKDKAVKAMITPPKTLRMPRLDDMNQEELRRELAGLPARISAAVLTRDALFAKLRERWSTAYANDQEFVTAYARAEAAGVEVQQLYQRTIKASRIWNERYTGRLV